MTRITMTIATLLLMAQLATAQLVDYAGVLQGIYIPGVGEEQQGAITADLKFSLDPTSQTPNQILGGMIDVFLDAEQYSLDLDGGYLPDVPGAFAIMGSNGNSFLSGNDIAGLFIIDPDSAGQVLWSNSDIEVVPPVPEPTGIQFAGIGILTAFGLLLSHRFRESA